MEGGYRAGSKTGGRLKSLTVYSVTVSWHPPCQRLWGCQQGPGCLASSARITAAKASCGTPVPACGGSLYIYISMAPEREGEACSDT